MQIIKTPGINGLGKTKGSRNAGNSIITGLSKIKHNEKGKEIKKNELDLEEIHVNNENLDEQEKLIYENSAEAFEEQDRVIFLGGDHSITFSTGKAFLDYCKKQDEEPCLIIFDAHGDCMPPMQNPTHEEWLRALIDSGFPVKNILLVGVRKIEAEEKDFLEDKKIQQVTVNRLNESLQETTDIIMEFAYGKTLYVSVDIDVVDPAFAPSTGHPEIGGLTSRQIIYILQRINMMKNLKAIDIVEVDIEADKKKDNQTVKLASKMLSELL